MIASRKLKFGRGGRGADEWNRVLLLLLLYNLQYQLIMYMYCLGENKNNL